MYEMWVFERYKIFACQGSVNLEYFRAYRLHNNCQLKSKDGLLIQQNSRTNGNFN